MIEQSREGFETCVKRELESVAQSTRAIIYSDARFTAILRVTVVEANGFGTRCMSLYLYLSRDTRKIQPIRSSLSLEQRCAGNPASITCTLSKYDVPYRPF